MTSTWQPTPDCPHCGTPGGTGFTHACIRITPITMPVLYPIAPAKPTPVCGGLGTQNTENTPSIWDCHDGQRAQANCRSNCKAEGHSPCLTCMGSFA